jgi:WD40 repeat protein
MATQQWQRLSVRMRRVVPLSGVEAHTSWALLIGLSAAAAPLQGCGGAGDATDPGSTPSEIQVSPDSLFVPQWSTAQLTVIVKDARGGTLSGYLPSLTSADTTIAKVSSGGKISSVGPQGRVEITVQAGGLRKKVPVIVTPVPTILDVTPAALTITQKDSAQLTVTILDATGAPVAADVATYTSSVPGTIRVTSAGFVVSLGAATGVQLQVQAGTLTKMVPVTIVQKPNAVVLTPSGTVEVPEQTSRQFTAVVHDLNGDPVQQAAVVWATGSALASVSATGLVTADAPGSVTLTATYHTDTFGDVSGSATVLVTQTTPPTATVPADLTAINTGGEPYDAAVAPNGLVIAVSGQGCCATGAVWATDLATFSAVTTLIPGGSPLTVRMDVNGAFAYVAGVDPAPGLGPGVSVIDLASQSQVGYLEHGWLGLPYSVGLSHDGQRAVMGTDGGNLVIFDVATRTWRSTLNYTSALFNHITAHPTQAKMYASSFGGALHPAVVVEIDLATETMRALPVPAAKPQGVAVSPDGTQLFVADENGPMQVWDLAANKSAGSIQAAQSGFGVTLSPDGHTLYQVGGRVLVIDVATHIVTKNYDVHAARRAGVSADGTKLVVASTDGHIYRFAP